MKQKILEWIVSPNLDEILYGPFKYKYCRKCKSKTGHNESGCFICQKKKMEGK